MRFIILSFLIFSFVSSFCRDFKNEFTELFSNSYNEEAIINVLKDWEKETPNDVELYVAYFNFYFSKSIQENLHLEKNIPNNVEENLTLTDSIGKKAGYIYSEKHYNDSLFNIAQKYIEKGIKINTRRLDLYLGKIYSLSQKEEYDKFLSEILRLIDLSNKINYRWLYTYNNKLENPKDFFKSTIQGYCYQLFNLPIPKYEVIKSISEKMILFFPKEVEFYSNIGTYYSVKKNFKKSLEFYLSAFKINSKDVIVINNIAYSYEQLKDSKNAIKYYDLLILYGNDEDKHYGKQAIEELNKKK